ncbi:DUF6678 family protein [Sphingomonas sp.]|uniref:DUF6678 family protein n=1 Tax=Sphingomonas sp. TaxID=28214 RepID=UPI003CC5C6A9
MLNPVMNNTKRDELRLAMYAITPPPSWSTHSTNGYRSSPDREWFYHFRDGGYELILYVDINVDSLIHRELVRSALKKVHVPGEELADGFRVFGYLEDGRAGAFL